MNYWYEMNLKPNYLVSVIIILDIQSIFINSVFKMVVESDDV